MGAHVYVWRFTVAEGQRQAFEALYGPRGDWIGLFRSSPDWLGTELLASPEHPGIYLTIDRWSSSAALDAFRASISEQWQEIDRRGEKLTTNEELIGEFDTIEPDPDRY